MIKLQVDDVIEKFNELKEHEARDWKIPTPSNPKLSEIKKSGRIQKIKSLKPSLSSSALRELIAEKRKEITDGAKKAEDDSKVFEGGFFNVHSPIRVTEKKTSLRKSLLSAETTSRRISSNPSTPMAMIRVSAKAKIQDDGVKTSNLFGDDKENK